MLKIIAISLSVLFLAGCASTDVKKSNTPMTPQAESPTSEKEFLLIAEKLMHAQIEALQKGDCKTFRDNLYEGCRDRVTPDSFKKLSRAFSMLNGKLERTQYLGTVSKYNGRTVLWKGWFARTPAMEQIIRKGGYDPAKVPQSESLIQMTVCYSGGQWKVFGIWAQ